MCLVWRILKPACAPNNGIAYVNKEIIKKLSKSEAMLVDTF